MGSHDLDNPSKKPDIDMCTHFVKITSQTLILWMIVFDWIKVIIFLGWIKVDGFSHPEKKPFHIPRFERLEGKVVILFEQIFWQWPGYEKITFQGGNW